MRKVKYARLQNNDCHLPEFGSFSGTLPPDKAAGKTYTVEMFEDGDKLLLNLTRNGKTYQAFIPLTNIQIAQYDDEPVAKATPVKKVS